MNKDLDFQIYNRYDRRNFPEDGPLHRKKVLQTRIFKLSTPQSQTQYESWGNLLLNSEQYEQSIFPLERASIINPKYWTNFEKLATVFLTLEQEDKAFSYIKQALHTAPSISGPHMLLLSALEERDRLEDLDSFYKEVADTLIGEVRVGALYFRAGESLVSIGKHSLALVYYQKAIEMVPEDSSYHYQYGMALYKERKFEEAIVEYEHVKSLSPNNKHCLNNIAFLHYILGRVEKAIEKLEEIIKNELEIYATYSNLILMLYHLHEDEEEIKPYKELLQPYLDLDREVLQGIYQTELKMTQIKLEESEIDEETKEYNMRKLKGLNIVLSLLN